MVAKRDRFQRVYDLTERVNSNHLKGSYEESEAKKIFTSRTIKALGVALPQWIPDYYRLPKTGQGSIIDSLVETGEILPLKVKGVEFERLYTSRPFTPF